jgi:hypothetical protein
MRERIAIKAFPLDVMLVSNTTEPHFFGTRTSGICYCWTEYVPAPHEPNDTTTNRTMASENMELRRSDDESNEGEGCDDDDDDSGERLHVHDGLCASVLAALLEFQHGGGGFSNDSDDDGVVLSRDEICAANQPKDNTGVIAATLRRLKEQD